MYRLSTYTKTLYLDDGNMLVSDLKSGRLFRIPRNWNKMEDGIIKKLEEIGIVTPLSVDEEFQQCISEMVQLRKCTDPLNVLVVSNYECNLKCQYCYQDRDIKVKERIQIPAEDIVNWVNKISSNHRECNISFMGGECLLNIAYIEKIMKAIANFKTAKVITNGVLLSKETIEMLYRIGIQQLMISIDGPKEMHDRRRENTYDVIMSNIQEALKVGLNVQLNVKIDNENADTIVRLFEELKAYEFPEKMEICFGFIQNTEKMQNHCKMHVFDDLQAGKAYRKLWKSLGERHIPFLNQIGIGTCPRDRQGTITVDCFGDVYKCISCVGNELDKIGSIYSMTKIEEVEIETEINESCRGCSYLPLCHGGCWYKDKLAGHHICRKQFFDEYTSVPFDQFLLRSRRE